MTCKRRIGGLLLAGGTSSRMGRTKQLLPLGDKSLLAVTVANALTSRLDPIILVLGYRAKEIQASVKFLMGNPKISVVVNRHFRKGMSESLKEGIKALIGFPIDGVLILLGDQPYVNVDVINRLIEAFLSSSRPICQPVYGGIKGNPVLFDRSLFPSLLKISGDQGGRVLLQEHPEWVNYVCFPDLQTGIDLDTPEAYESLKAQWEDKLSISASRPKMVNSSKTTPKSDGKDEHLA
jgi:molybdenum cofactor cytidylyltransferase